MTFRSHLSRLVCAICLLGLIAGPAAAQTTNPYPNGVTDLTVRPIPSVTVPAGVNSTFLDTSFGRTIKRLTNGTVGSTSSLNGSHRLPSSEQVAAIGHASDRFYLTTPHGTVEYFTLDKATKNATYIRDLPFTSEPTFSRVQPAVIYGAVGYKVIAYNTDTQVTTTLFDLTKIDPTYAVAPLVLGGSVQSSAGAVERLIAFYGGSSQDKHFRAAVFDTTGSAPTILDTVARTINGAPVSIDFPFHLHAIGMDQSGRYAILYPTGTDQQAGAAPAYFWDVTTNTVAANHTSPYGHDAAGYGVYVNQDNGPCSPYDAAQWQFRTIAALTSPKCVISPPLTPKMAAEEDHPQWNNASATTVTPFADSMFRYYEDTVWNLETDPAHRTNTVAWRPWDNEIISVDPTTGKVWRWTHHFAVPYADDGSSMGNSFWYQPFVQIAPDNSFLLFDSNMLKSLGLDQQEPNPATKYRVDTFLIDTALPLTTSTDTTVPTSPIVVSPLTVTRGQAFTITVSSDGIDVDTLELFMNGVSQGAKVYSATGTTWTYASGEPTGTYTFTATAAGPGGMSDPSDAYTVTVKAGKPSKPTVKGGQ